MTDDGMIEAGRTPKNPGHGGLSIVRRLAETAGIFLAAAALLGYLGRFWWFADNLSHFRVQYAAGLALVAVILFLLRRREAAGWFLLVALINLAEVLPYWFHGPAEAADPGTFSRAILMNVNSRSGDPGRVAETIRHYDPDLVVLEEVTDGWLETLEGALAGYPHRETSPRSDNFGIALYSRFAFLDSGVVFPGESKVPSILADLEGPGGRFRLIAAHPLPPISRGYADARNRQLRALADLVRESKDPVLLLGDLNATPWSTHFRRLLRRSGLSDSLRGAGLQPSWPTFQPLLRIPIDHCLYSPRIRIVRRRLGPAIGSDHFPLIVDFEIRRTATAEQEE